MYKLKTDCFGVVNGVINTTTGWVIPFDNDNVDYQKYLVWVDEGNTPEPADEA